MSLTAIFTYQSDFKKKTKYQVIFGLATTKPKKAWKEALIRFKTEEFCSELRAAAKGKEKQIEMVIHDGSRYIKADENLLRI